MTPERLAEIRRIATETGCSLLTEALDEIERLNYETACERIAELERERLSAVSVAAGRERLVAASNARITELERETQTLRAILGEIEQDTMLAQHVRERARAALGRDEQGRPNTLSRIAELERELAALRGGS